MRPTLFPLAIRHSLFAPYLSPRTRGNHQMTNPRALRLNAEDNVVISVDEIRPGDAPAGAPAASERIPRGHKMATVEIPTGAPVRKFGQIIGFASRPILPGQWVHEHNCVVHDFE